MGLVCEHIERGENRRQYDRSVAVANGDGWARSAVAAEQTRLVVQRLQSSLMGCQARIDYSRAQVTASRALLESRPAE
jgi:hypothetical protein